MTKNARLAGLLYAVAAVFGSPVGGNAVIPRWILVVPRLFLGLIFAVAVHGKLAAPAPFKIILGGFLTQVLPSASSLYRSFAHAIVLPNLGLVASLVIAGELYVALAMLFGATTRLASVVAALLLVNYMLAKGMNLWTPASNDAADIILAVVVCIGAAGRVAGIDRFLAARWPRIPLW